MKIPNQLLARLDPAMRGRAEAPKDVYLENLEPPGGGDLKGRTKDVLWHIYQREGYKTFMQVVANMHSYAGRDPAALTEVKGEVAEVVLEIIISQYVKEFALDDWRVVRGLILGNEKNKDFSTELDLTLVTPKVVTIFEIKSWNGDKVVTERCTLTAGNGENALSKDVFRQNRLHIQAFWDNFGKYAKGEVGCVKSVLFSFARGSVRDERDESDKAVMPVYDECGVAGYLIAVHLLDRAPVWEVDKLVGAIEKAQREGRSADDHLSYVRSLHGGGAGGGARG